MPLLIHIFHTFVGPDTPVAMNWIIEDILNVLNKTDIVAITKEKEATYGARDPIIHFYDLYGNEIKQIIGAHSRLSTLSALFPPAPPLAISDYVMT